MGGGKKQKTKQVESNLGGGQNKEECVGRVASKGGGSEELNSKTTISRHDAEYIWHKEGPENTLVADSCLALWKDEAVCLSLRVRDKRARQILFGIWVCVCVSNKTYEKLILPFDVLAYIYYSHWCLLM